MKTVGELVVYGANGVCRIEDIRDESFTGSARRYYILKPITEAGNSRIFVPTDNEKLVGDMKKLLQPAELFSLVAAADPFDMADWPSDGRSRSKLCRDILASGDREQLVRLIKTVFSQKKTPSASEESVCFRAAIMLYQEFSLVLAIEKADVIPFVLGQMQPAVKG
ncbi:MAG: CarD family transcriptional regulator [Clostridia bacterium]|nr:CarD family transcriptional regulator [Clostridia bacterium]